MATAFKSVEIFVILYFIYYYVLRFIQFIFQSTMGCINNKLAHFIYLIGTPAHEIAHLLVALLCFCNINQVKLFSDQNGPGCVGYSIRKSTIPGVTSIKEFFIGIAPALINIPLFIFIESRFVLKCNVSQIIRIITPQVIMSKEGLITLLLFIVLLSGIAPSHQDLKGMIPGLITFSAIIFVITYVTGYFINIKSFMDLRALNASGLLTVILYYLEILTAAFILNAILNYNRFITMTINIIASSAKHTFEKN